MIEIYAVTYNGQPASAELKGVFGDDGGSIGRSHENRLVLPDPARHVSRVQVRIRSDGARFWLANVSDANPVFVNDQEVSARTELPLVSGDEIRMGLYVLRAREPTGAAIAYQALPSVRVAPPPLAPVPMGDAGAGSVDALLGGASAGESPFADLLGGAALPPTSAPGLPGQGTSTAPQALDQLQQFGGMPAPDPAVARSAASPISSPVSATPAAAALAALGAQGPSPGVGADPFADLLGSTPQAARQRPLREPDTSKPFPGGTIPDDFDPFSTPAPTRNSDDPLKDLAKAPVDLGGVADRAAGSLVDFTLDGQKHPRDALRGGTPSLVDPLQAVDPMKLFGGAEDRLLADGRAEPTPGAMPMRDDVPELGAFFAPPRSIEDPALPNRAAGAPGQPAPAFPAASAAHVPQQPAEQPATSVRPSRPTVAPSAPPTPALEARRPRPTSPAPANADGAVGTVPPGVAAQDPLIAAFLEGAHAANVPIPGGLTPALMRQLGALVFQAVAGAMALIAARQITKREIGAEMTMIVASGNNPLKFLPTPEAAITQMIGPRMPGFMTPEAAMRNAFEDLSAHEIGVIAGTRAAFAEVLRRFDPQQLEERLGKGGMLDAVLPVARRGKLWSLYQERYHQIHSEAQDEFDSLFGQAFTKAYEEEVARQRSQRAPE